MKKQKQDKEFFKKLTKKEQINFIKKLEKMEKTLGGIKEMKALPDAIFAIDTIEEKVAILEANKLNIPIIAIVDSNSDPSEINYPIPVNDDSKLAIDLILNSVLKNCKKEKIKKKKKTIKKSKKSEKKVDAE